MLFHQLSYLPLYLHDVPSAELSTTLYMLFHQLSYLPLYLYAVLSAKLSTPVFTYCSIRWAIYPCIYMVLHQLSSLPLYLHAVPSAELSFTVLSSWAVCQHFLYVSKFHQKFRGISSILSHSFRLSQEGFTWFGYLWWLTETQCWHVALLESNKPWLLILNVSSIMLLQVSQEILEL
jgi:hypothetical protein